MVVDREGQASSRSDFDRVRAPAATSPAPSSEPHLGFCSPFPAQSPRRPISENPRWPGLAELPAAPAACPPTAAASAQPAYHLALFPRPAAAPLLLIEPLAPCPPSPCSSSTPTRPPPSPPPSPPSSSRPQTSPSPSSRAQQTKRPSRSSTTRRPRRARRRARACSQRRSVRWSSGATACSSAAVRRDVLLFPSNSLSR